MLKIIDLRKRNISTLRTAFAQAQNNTVERTVIGILRSVQKNGDAALRYYTKKYDGAEIRSIAVSRNRIIDGQQNADKKFIKILEAAASNIRKFHFAQIRKQFTLKVNRNSELRQIYRPIEKVGVYVPGGKAAYPSTVLMNVIPAQVAGVKEIFLASPPDKFGNIHPDVLLACSLLGIENVFRVGGAQAIAAFAFGTKTIPAVDKIVGPGNIYVATAKKLVFGSVGIDNFAGPSEIVILADNSANATYVASDLLAQAEHDERSVPILVTTSRLLAEKVNKELLRLWPDLSRQNILKISLKKQGRIYLVSSLQQGIAVTNTLAPEHLEIITKNDESVLKQIKHAGSIFLGNYSPVALGDYYAGPNHVLPTEGTSRFSSPLSADDFIKKSSVVQYSKKDCNAVADDIKYFAIRENLTAHALSLHLRTQK